MKIELWEIAKWPGKNSAHAGGLFPPTPKLRRQRHAKEVDTGTLLRHSDCFYFQRRINKTRRE
jgi:hypothetical protein